MKLLILSRNRFLYSTRRLAQAASLRGHNVVIADPTQCVAKVGPETNVSFDKMSLDDVEVVIPRLGAPILDAGIRVVAACEAMGIGCLNASAPLQLARNKYRVTLALASADVAMPCSMLVQNAADVASALESIGTPVVLKTLDGSQGVGVMLAESEPSARSIADAMLAQGKALLFQSFVAKARGRDSRLVVVGDSVVAAIERSAGDADFRANVHRGGETKALKVSDRLRDVALNATRALGLSVAGVDVLMSPDGPLVIDVNGSPGLEGVEGATGVDIAAKIIEQAEHVLK